MVEKCCVINIIEKTSVFSQSLVTLLILTQVDLIIVLSYHLSFITISLIDWFSCSNSSFFECQHHVFLSDEHLEISDKVQFYEIFPLSLNPFNANISNWNGL
jgi:hypothetical protein